jgi:hypothetical protein
MDEEHEEYEKWLRAGDREDAEWLAACLQDAPDDWADVAVVLVAFKGETPEAFFRELQRLGGVTLGGTDIKRISASLPDEGEPPS